MAKMSDEEYLRARGWRAFGPAWTHHTRRLDNEPGGEARFTIVEAVKAQLAEDRAAHNFVRARSDMRDGMLLAPSGDRAATSPNAPKEPSR